MPAALVKVMISSRVGTPLQAPHDQDHAQLADVRGDLERSIEGLTLGGERVFEVWLNEGQPGSGVSIATWVDECLTQVDDVDIVVVLFTGEAGSTGPGAATGGICYAEFARARSSRKGLVLYFDLRHLVVRPNAPDRASAQFESIWTQANLYAPPVSTVAELLEMVTLKLTEVLVNSTRQVLKRPSSAVMAIELPWASQTYEERRSAMQAVASEVLAVDLDSELAILEIGADRAVIVVSCVPDPLSVARPREDLGRPHLVDAEQVDLSDDADIIGPIHLVLVRGAVTLAQGRALIGDPEAFIVKTPFGVWAAERSYGAQICLVGGCLDPDSTRLQLRAAQEWIPRMNGQQAAELGRLRAAICRAVATR